MADIKVYNQKGEVTQEIELPKAFQVKWNADLVHQIVKAILANQRKPVAHTKNRGEVRGGGVKPWRQKGTGRARHGSIRSPLWVGGGVSFGPRKDKVYTQKVNKKMMKKALFCVLSKKAADGQIKVLESLELATNKTKPLANIFKKIIGNNSAVLLAPKENKNLILASRNLANVKSALAGNLNAYTALNCKDILMDKKTFEMYSK